jgi:hypothetical protein
MQTQQTITLFGTVSNPAISRTSKNGRKYTAFGVSIISDRNLQAFHYNVVAWGKQGHLSMNVGLPASTWDKSDTASLYKCLSVAGWNLGATVGPITFVAARSALASVSPGGKSKPTGIDADTIETFPEFGAQVHSYRSSAQRQKDLHLLVDVGAGTVDIVTFHIGDENESEINCILEPLVRKLGTHVLLGYRAQAAALNGRTLRTP